jgi:hypothetical protein
MQSVGELMIIGGEASQQGCFRLVYVLATVGENSERGLVRSQAAGASGPTSSR